MGTCVTIGTKIVVLIGRDWFLEVKTWFFGSGYNWVKVRRACVCQKRGSKYNKSVIDYKVLQETF